MELVQSEEHAREVVMEIAEAEEKAKREICIECHKEEASGDEYEKSSYERWKKEGSKVVKAPHKWEGEAKFKKWQQGRK